MSGRKADIHFRPTKTLENQQARRSVELRDFRVYAVRGLEKLKTVGRRCPEQRKRARGTVNIKFKGEF